MSTESWQRRCDGLSDDLAFLASLAPLVEDHAGRSDGMRLPIGGAGNGGGSQLDYSDPTLATVAQMVDDGAHRGGPYEEAQDRAVLRTIRNAMRNLSDLINHDLASRARAAATAIREGRPPTSGRGQVEEEIERHGRAIHESDICGVCGNVGPTQLKLCKARCYHRWYRSKDREQGVDRGAWIARERHRFLVDELVGQGIYGEDLVNLSIHELEEVLSGKRKLRRHRHQTEWDESVHTSIGPADGQDRR